MGRKRSYMFAIYFIDWKNMQFEKIDLRNIGIRVSI
jgi:hypothetical protein